MYYGYFAEWRSAMLEMCRSSRVMWKENEKVFEKWISKYRKILHIITYFNADTVNFLLDQNRYEKYYLSCLLYFNNTDIFHFLDFISKVPKPNLLKFSRIHYSSIYYEFMELVSLLFKFFFSKRSLIYI